MGIEPAAISWSSDSCNVNCDVLVIRTPKGVIFVHNKQHFSMNRLLRTQKMWNASRFCVSFLRRGHANLLCIVPILVYVLPKQVHQGEQKILRTKDFQSIYQMVFIKGRKDILRVLKPVFKEQIWILRLENAPQIANLSLIFAIFLA